MKNLFTLALLLFCGSSIFAQKTIFSNDTIDIIDVIDVENYVFVPSITACEGQLITLNAYGNNITSYTWSNGETTPSIDVRAELNMSYSVTVTFLSGTSAVVTPNITVLPVPAITISGPSQISAGLMLTLNTNTNGYTYNWDHNGGANAFATFTPSRTTTYSVTVTTANGCSTVASHKVTVLASLANNWATEYLPLQDATSATSEQLKWKQSPNDEAPSASNSLSANTQLTISPNPCVDNVVFNMTLPYTQNLNLQLYNSTGQVLESRQLGQVQNVNENFDVANLPAGIYMIAVQNEGTVLALEKLIKL